MKKVTQEYYNNDIAYNKFFGKKKKISFDTNEHFLEIIDKLAELSSNNRTVIINALIGAGMAPFFKILETTWEGFLKDKKYEKISKDLKKLLQDLKKLKEENQIEYVEKEYRKIKKS